MKKLILLSFLMLTSVLSLKASMKISADKGYMLSLSSEEKETTQVTRDQMLFIHGPFLNETGSSISASIGVEFKNTVTGDCYFKSIRKRKQWEDNISVIYISFDFNFVIQNGTYAVRPIVTEDDNENIRENWEYIPVPEDFIVPTIEIIGDPLFAYFSYSPYVGTSLNVAEISNTKMYVNLTANKDLDNSQLIAFVYNTEDNRSIGYYRFNISLVNGESKDFEAEYVKSGSIAAPLEAGQQYLLSFMLFVDNKQVFFDGRYEDMMFKVVENGLTIDALNSNYDPYCKDKVIIDGKIYIKGYNLFGRKI